MNLLDFSAYFPDEESCIKHFKSQREQIGISCKKCNNTTHYWKNDKIAFECKNVDIELLFEVVRLWKIAICPIHTGIKLYYCYQRQKKRSQLKKFKNNYDIMNMNQFGKCFIK